MSALAGHSFLVQFDRELLLDLIQTKVAIAGTPLQPPFRFQRLIPAGGFPLERRKNSVDIVMKSVRLALKPGTRLVSVLCDIEAGVLRLEADEIPLTRGTVRIEFEFHDGTLLELKPVSISLQGITSDVADFQNRANAELGKLLLEPTARSTALLDKDEYDLEFRLLFAFSTMRIIDDTTLGIFMGSGQPGEATRSISSGNDLSFAMSAERAQQLLLARALLEPGDRDPAWRAGQGPTELEKTKLPAPFGTGHIAKERDGVQVRITEMNFSFRDGYLDVVGKFEANDTGWSVNDGTFSQRVYLDFNKAAGTVLPRLEPAEPGIQYTVDVSILLELAAFFIGLIVPLVGSVVLGAVAVIAIEVAKTLVKPDVPAQKLDSQSIPSFPGIVWDSVAVVTEGLVLEGLMHRGDGTGVYHYSDSRDPSTTRVLAVAKPKDLVEGPGGETLYQAPMCEARYFHYIDFTQTDVKDVDVEYQWLIEPVQVAWDINGTEIPADGGSPLKFVAPIRTALPPPDGAWISGHTVELAYDFGLSWPIFSPARLHLTLTPRKDDLIYSIKLTAHIRDASGRSFWNTVELRFNGVRVLFGEDYDTYRQECLKKLQQVIDKKSKMKTRLKPGEPQEMSEWYARYIQQYISGRSQSIGDVVTGAIKMEGLEAVVRATAKRLSK